MVDPRQKLAQLIKPKPQNEVTYRVTAIETRNLHYIQIYLPKLPIEKLFPGFSAIKKVRSLKRVADENQENSVERSIRRTKKAIRDYTLNNNFDLFVTFTFKTDRDNITKIKRQMSNWLKNQQKRKGKFEYLIVPEFHKDGKSIHFHALIKGYAGELRPSQNPKTGLPLLKRGKQAYTIPSYMLGYSDAQKIEDTPESHAKVGHYIAKYVTKDMPLFFNKNRYWVSTGLAKSTVIYNPDDWYSGRKPLWSKESEFGTTLIFNKDAHKDELPF
jgi:hypothetical protein